MTLTTVAVLALALAAPTAAAAFHNRLAKCQPAADESVASPKEIRLWFTEKVEPKLGSITLMTADSVKVEVGKARATDDPKSIAADVATTLATGRIRSPGGPRATMATPFGAKSPFRSSEGRVVPHAR